MLAHVRMLPFVPSEVLSRVLGRASRSWVTRQLARLQGEGLVRAFRVRSGSGPGRPLSLWVLTQEGQFDASESVRQHAKQRLPRQWRQLVVHYELLGWVAAALPDNAGAPDVSACEFPWKRSVHGTGGHLLGTPTVATLSWSTGDARRSIEVMLVADLGWAPVSLYGRSLPALVTAWSRCGMGPFALIVGTPATPGRVEAWRDIVERLPSASGEVVQPIVTTWDAVQTDRLGVRLHAESSERLPEAASPARTYRKPGRACSCQKGGRDAALLQLIGRHPFLPLGSIAGLLGMRTRATRERLDGLVDAGLVRWSRANGTERLASGLEAEQPVGTWLPELTREGLRETAATLGLALATAVRLHGLVGGGPEHPSQRRAGLVRCLAHTLGADALFVAMHLAASSIGRGALVRWDNAAACARGWCRPDGYGVCRLGTREIGFFIEYDRGTQRARDYAGKWQAYYDYRDSGRAARDYASFPLILVVTVGSEQPVLLSARAAALGRWSEPLSILCTTTGWVASQTDGILGPIWRTPGAADRRFSLGVLA